MTRFHTSRPDAWLSPRPTRDPAQRVAHYGPLVGMDDKPGLLASVPLWASAIGIAVVVMLAVWR